MNNTQREYDWKNPVKGALEQVKTFGPKIEAMSSPFDCCADILFYIGKKSLACKGPSDESRNTLRAATDPTHKAPNPGPAPSRPPVRNRVNPGRTYTKG